ncbi:MAG TPA: class I SAM-dependent methyltransferase [Vicinamibacterales bacterium]|nr:class I SAM-dependent methyltransferase [Vicinamibacterales bacterium]
MKGSSETYLTDSYSAKNPAYYGNARRDYVAALPVDGSAAILELGCGNGATGALALAEGKCGRYVGIEMFAPMAAQARRVLTAVHEGNVETLELPYEEGTFDALIMSEVLEHLLEPDIVLARLVRLVKPGGRVFASSPNIAHWRPIWDLINGRFEYQPQGLMDRTHLRWFTPDSYRRMFERAGVTVDSLRPLVSVSRPKQLVFALLGPRFAHLSCSQMNLHGHRSLRPHVPA